MTRGTTLLAACAALGIMGCNGGGDGGAITASCAAESGNICTIAGTGVAGDGADRRSALKTNLYLPQDVTIGPEFAPPIVGPAWISESLGFHQK